MQGLAEEGYALDVAFDGREGLLMALDGVHDLIILDINLPKLDGLGVLQEFSKKHGETPVLLPTVRAAIEDKVLGLDTGADGHPTRPFSFQELLPGSGLCSGGEWKPFNKCGNYKELLLKPPFDQGGFRGNAVHLNFKRRSDVILYLSF